MKLLVFLPDNNNIKPLNILLYTVMYNHSSLMSDAKVASLIEYGKVKR